ncbi:PR domain zinc finger protein 15-like isoform X2 [Cottoperca gobio]|uniref:PR domain zinc finger protein 15-like isoform X2 n=1 Tax=Cottoperca gobio TaxID=56716 RepID=A0A6J2Q1M8_COTGO|nr:PR domain zinc finger protein 15-like isoform X2 [Cottoperca gobio]
MEHESPDFVPSVFLSTKHRPKRKVKRKRRCRAADVETEEKMSPSRGDCPADLPSSAGAQEQTPSVLKEGETSPEEAESSTDRASPVKAPARSLHLHKMIPVVLLKHVFVSAGGFKCEKCNQNFPNIPQLMKHKQLHEEEEAAAAEEEEEEEAAAEEEDAEEEEEEEEEAAAEEEDAEEEGGSLVCEMCGKLFPGRARLSDHRCPSSFSCNMCDRTFVTSRNLKRHKLQHVKDGRKCPKCGVLFCKRHNHILFLPQADSITEYEDDSIEPSRPPRTPRTPPPASHTGIFSGIPAPLTAPAVSRLPPPVPRCKNASSQFKCPPYVCPAAFLQPLPPQHPELPPSLKLFSPQHLTSALLEVKRNSEYIFSKQRAVKQEPCELPLVPPDEQTVTHGRRERTAYDLEIVI